MIRSAARVQRIVPVSVTSRTLAHWSSVISTSSAVPPRPALFTAMSRRPCASSEAAYSACTWSSSVTSQGTATGSALALPAGRGRADAGAGGRGDHGDLAGQQVVPRGLGGNGRWRRSVGHRLSCRVADRVAGGSPAGQDLAGRVLAGIALRSPRRRSAGARRRAAARGSAGRGAPAEHAAGRVLAGDALR